jgi:hypothetical protein
MHHRKDRNQAGGASAMSGREQIVRVEVFSDYT